MTDPQGAQGRLVAPRWVYGIWSLVGAFERNGGGRERPRLVHHAAHHRNAFAAFRPNAKRPIDAGRRASDRRTDRAHLSVGQGVTEANEHPAFPARSSEDFLAENANGSQQKSATA